jgi:hypothetical protein
VNVPHNTKGKTVTKTVANQPSLCLENAEWIVEDFEEGGGLVPFANFGTVTFTVTGASATTTSGTVGPGSVTIIDIRQSGTVYTSSSAGSSSVTVSYV